MRTFIDRAVAGEGGPDDPLDIDDYIEAWHRGEGEDVCIATFLGMSEREYRLWVEWPNALAYIVERRREEARLRAERDDFDRRETAALRTMEKAIIENAALRDLVTEAEWRATTGAHYDPEDGGPWCMNDSAQGHAPDCRAAALMGWAVR